MIVHPVPQDKWLVALALYNAFRVQRAQSPRRLARLCVQLVVSVSTRRVQVTQSVQTALLDRRPRVVLVAVKTVAQGNMGHQVAV